MGRPEHHSLLQNSSEERKSGQHGVIPAYPAPLDSRLRGKDGGFAKASNINGVNGAGMSTQSTVSRRPMGCFSKKGTFSREATSL